LLSDENENMGYRCIAIALHAFGITGLSGVTVILPVHLVRSRLL